MLFRTKTEMVSEADALPGRTDQTMPVPDAHYVNGHPLQGPWPEGYKTAVFGLGCFWGAEKLFWELPGVWSTAVGYAGGYTPNPTYEEVCSGRTGHAEVVLVVYDPAVVSYEQLLKAFWEDHDPSQGMRQGNDVGTQYRSAIYTADDEQRSCRRGDQGAATARPWARRGTARSRPRSSRSATSTTPSRTTSSTSPRTPAGTAPSTRRVSAAGSNVAP